MKLDNLIDGSFPNYRGPLCSTKDKVLVLDVDGVLLRQMSTLKNNHPGRDTYKPVASAETILKRAKKDHFGALVIWTTSPQSMEKLASAKIDLSSVDYFIAGAEIINGDVCKNLSRVSTNFSNIFAIEDDCYFFPGTRVIPVMRNERSLWKGYQIARERMASC